MKSPISGALPARCSRGCALAAAKTARPGRARVPFVEQWVVGLCVMMATVPTSYCFTSAVAQVVLCFSMTLRCRLAAPLDGLGRVLLHTFTFVVADSQIALCFNMTPLSRLAVPLDSLG